jgi:hypothetical protein
VSLRPYDLAAARFSSPNVRLTNPQITLVDKAQVALEHRLQDLGARVAALSNSSPMGTLENPGFEIPEGEGKIAGWVAEQPGKVAGAETGAAADTFAQLDPAEKHGGDQSLKLLSAGPRTIIRSAPLEAPHSGRLSVAAWVRIADPKRQPTLRMAIEGQLEDAPFYRYAVVGGEGPRAVPLTNKWASYIFQVDDLPAEGLTDLRLRFELMGAGEAWIDDVQLFDLAFSENERVELTKIIALANYELSAGHLADCARLLEGYWPQFLVANVPLTQSSIAVVQRVRTVPPKVPAAESPAPPEEKPGLLNRAKGYVPKFLQF